VRHADDFPAKNNADIARAEERKARRFLFTKRHPRSGMDLAVMPSIVIKVGCMMSLLTNGIVKWERESVPGARQPRRMQRA